MRRIYIAHPFGGKDENKQKVERIIKKLIKKHPDILFVSPIHCTGFYYHDVTYEKGMEYCFELLNMCDTLLLCGDWKKSTGCCMEYGYAFARGKDIMYL
jgi:nucleoside 2-deoxyribosyltransferase